MAIIMEVLETEQTPLTISLVVPIYSGANYLRTLVDEVDQLRSSFQSSPIDNVEMILVNDDAIDNSAALVDELAKEHSWVTALHLSRNFGQHAATAAGILHSRGDWVVTLDEDFQHPPAFIPQLLRKAVTTPCDLVYAVSSTRVHETWLRDGGSRLMKWSMKWITGNHQYLDLSSFRLIRGSVARAAAKACKYDSYFDVILFWFTQKSDAIKLELRDTRHADQRRSGYSMRSLVSHARRMIFTGQTKIIRISAISSAVLAAVSVGAATSMMMSDVLSAQATVSRMWLFLVIAMAFWGSAILFLMSIALEYLSILAMRSHGRPSFFVVDRSRDELLKKHFTGI